MLIESTFIRGAGSVVVGKAQFTDESCTELFGSVALYFADQWGKRRLTPSVTAKVMSGAQRIELMVGPLKGRMFKNPILLPNADADYFGFVGPLDEILVWGWEVTSRIGERNIWLEFEPARLRNRNAIEEINRDFILEV